MNEFRIDLVTPSVPADPVRRRHVSPRVKIGILALVIAGVFAFAIAGNNRPIPMQSFSWPSGLDLPTYISGPCGEAIRPPVVSGAKALATPTGIKLLVGGLGIHEVDLDSGEVTTTDRVSPNDNLTIADLAVDASGFIALRSRCGGPDGDAAILSGKPGSPATVRPDEVSQSLLLGGDHLWAIGTDWTATESAVTISDDGGGKTYIIKQRLFALDGKTAVPIPTDTQPVAGYGEKVVALITAEKTTTLALVQPDFSGAATSLISLGDIGDSRSAVVLTKQGSADLIAAWTPTSCNGGSECLIKKFDLRSKQRSVRSFSIPAQQAFTPIKLSPDGNLLLGGLTELPVATAVGYSGYAIADLRTGELSVVPGLSTSGDAGYTSVVFSSDSGWLIVGVNTARKKFEFYLWHPGDATLLRSPAAVDSVLIRAPIAVLP